MNTVVLASRLARAAAVCVACVFMVTPAVAQDPYKQANNTWISIDGRIEDVSSNSFILNYGDGVVKVEMDDEDRDADAYPLLKGDQVRVTGKIDDDLFERTSIEASSVFVKNLGTYFFASPRDEEDAFITSTPIVESRVVVQGEVTQVSDHEFTVDTGDRTVRVEVAQLSYNPLDDEGYQQIDIGDRVSVTGTINAAFFDGRELVADAIVTLSG